MTDKKKIFVIDDDQDFRGLINTMLRDQLEVCLFDTAQKALDAFPKLCPDLVISDLHMPQMDGVALRHALSEQENGDTTPFIFISGDTDIQNHAYINQLGIDDFLTKPVQRKKLLSVVHRLLLRSSQIQDSVAGRFGRDVTKILRPNLPETIGNWCICLRNQMAEIGGGDFILHRQYRDENHIVLADVMGHGLQAKFFAYAYAGYLRSVFYTEDHAATPDTFLNSLSRTMGRDPFLESTIMSCLAIWLNDNGQIDLAAAGHPAPLVFQNQKWANTKAAGPLPGLGNGIFYNIQKYNFQRGDQIVLYTDGLIETARDPDKAQKNFLTLNTILASNKGVEPTILADQLWEALIQPASIQDDDATLAIVEYQPKGKHDERDKPGH